MNDSATNRRRIIAALASAVMLGVRAPSVAAAQQPAGDQAQAVTTGLFEKVIAWNDPWTREADGTPVAELPLRDADSDVVVGSHTYDALSLIHPNRSMMEFSFVPLPDFGMRWALPSRWEGASGEVILDEGWTPGGRYAFSFFAFDGVEYGRWSTYLSPAYAAMIDTRSLVAPVTEFGSTLAALLEQVSLNDAPVFDRLNPAVLQRKLNPLVGTALAAAPAR